MKTRTVIILLTTVLLTVRCQKEFLCDFCSSENNQPPVAKAGLPVTLTLPVDSTQLTGDASFDPDGTITNYNWRKIQGPTGESIRQPQHANTIVSHLAEGVYQFELMVTDDGGLTGKDTVAVTVIHPDSAYAPIACTAPDITIVLPVNNVLLDGSCTTDPDNNITDYQWIKIGGPASYNIISPNAPQTQVTDLEAGIYRFRLTVTDQDAQSSWDDIFVEVINPDTCSQYPPYPGTPHMERVGFLSQDRDVGVVIAAGGKIFYAGGLTSTDVPTDRVDIYDIAQDTWTTSNLSVARSSIAAVSSGNKVYFAGGVSSFFPPVVTYTNVDVYDLTTGTWHVEHLSLPGTGIGIAAVGNKILFAGGLDFSGSNRSNQLDIYDQGTNSWSTASLTYAFSVANDFNMNYPLPVVNNKVYFTGGHTPNQTNTGLEYYDNQSGTLGIAPELDYSKTGFSIATINNKIYLGGGVGNQYPVCHLEIRDPLTGTSIETNTGIHVTTSAIIQDKIIYSNGSDFTLYNTANNTWLQGQFPSSIYTVHSLIGVNNAVYMVVPTPVGVPNEVWRADF